MEVITLTKEYVQQTNIAFEELKKLIDSGKTETGEGKERMDKLNEIFDKYEVENQKFVTEQEKVKAVAFEQKELLEAYKKEDQEKILEQKERIDALELSYAQSPYKGDADSKRYKESDQYKAFECLFKFDDKGEAIRALPEAGKSIQDIEHKQLMRTDANVAGGFLIPTELDAILRKEIVEISNIRKICRVRTMSVKLLEIAVRTSNLVATYEGETEEDEKSISLYRNVAITPFRQSVTVPFTQDIIMDAAFDIEREIREDVATAFARGEGANNINGDGVKKPEGFLQNATIVASARQGTGESGKIFSDDIILLTGDLKEGYDPSFVLNRRTLAQIRILKGTTQNVAGAENVGGDGQYLWLPALNGSVSPTLAGEPYLIANDMPDISADALALAFGDFRRGYEIFDRTGTMMIRDIFSQARQAIVQLTFMRWNTGRVVIPEAITALKIKVPVLSLRVLIILKTARLKTNTPS